MARRDLGSDAPLLRVPSTKQEVFRSRDLGLAEKRFLMKFMQRCFDEAVEDAATQNENALNVGRALSRPQNKRASADAHRGAGEAEDENEPAVAALECAVAAPALLSSLLTPCFRSTPAQRCPLLCATPCCTRSPASTATRTRTASPPRSCALGSSSASSRPLPSPRGMHPLPRVAWPRYVTSLGQYSVTAFLAPVYGASELGQGFCRMAAVSGSVYVLRRHLTALLTRKVRPTAAPTRVASTPTRVLPMQSTGAVLGAMDSEGTFLRAKAVVAEEGAMAAWAEDGAPAFTLAEAAEGRGVSEPPQDAQPGAEGGEEAGGPEAGEGDGAGSAQAAGAETSEVDRERYSARARTLLDALGALPPPPAPRWAPTVVARAVAVFDRPLLPHRATVRHPAALRSLQTARDPTACLPACLPRRSTGCRCWWCRPTQSRCGTRSPLSCISWTAACCAARRARVRRPPRLTALPRYRRLTRAPRCVSAVLVQLSCLSHGDSAEEAGQKGCCVLRDAVASLAAIADAAGGGEAATAGAASSDSLGDSAAGGADSTAQRKPWKVHLWRVFYTVRGRHTRARPRLCALTPVAHPCSQRFLLPCDPDAAAHKPSNVHVPRSAPALCMFSEADVVRRPAAGPMPLPPLSPPMFPTQVTAEQEFRALCPGLDFLPPKEDHPAEAEVEDVEVGAAMGEPRRCPCLTESLLPLRRRSRPRWPSGQAQRKAIAHQGEKSAPARSPAARETAGRSRVLPLTLPAARVEGRVLCRARTLCEDATRTSRFAPPRPPWPPLRQAAVPCSTPCPAPVGMALFLPCCGVVGGSHASRSTALLRAAVPSPGPIFSLVRGNPPICALHITLHVPEEAIPQHVVPRPDDPPRVIPTAKQCHTW